MFCKLGLFFAALSCAVGMSPSGLSCDFSSSFCNYINSHFVLTSESNPHQITCNDTSQAAPYECDLTSAPIQLFVGKYCLEFEYRAVVNSSVGYCAITVDQLFNGQRKQLYADNIGINDWELAQAAVENPGTIRPFTVEISVNRSHPTNQLFMSPIIINEGDCN